MVASNGAALSDSGGIAMERDGASQLSASGSVAQRAFTAATERVHARETVGGEEELDAQGPSLEHASTLPGWLASQYRAR